MASTTTGTSVTVASRGRLVANPSATGETVPLRRPHTSAMNRLPGGSGDAGQPATAARREFPAARRHAPGDAGCSVREPDLAVAAPRPAEHRHDGPAKLTRRQREVLTLLARGLSNSAIAASLFITEKSVVEHVSNVYDALGLTNTGEEHRRVLAALHFVMARSGDAQLAVPDPGRRSPV